MNGAQIQRPADFQLLAQATPVGDPLRITLLRRQAASAHDSSALAAHTLRIVRVQMSAAQALAEYSAGQLALMKRWARAMAMDEMEQQQEEHEMLSLLARKGIKPPADGLIRRQSMAITSAQLQSIGSTLAGSADHS